MYTLQKHLQYNAWADGKIAEILSNLDEKLLDAIVISSFPSIRKTVLHIWDAQQIWLTRLEGGTANGWPSDNFKGDTKEMLQGYLATSNKLAEMGANHDAAFFERHIAYKNTKGIEFSNAADDMLFHMVNHSSYHRGQIITMLRQLGIDKFPAQDLIAYVRQLEVQPV
jgi:uncharacterized damage-inducible protein DinB